MRRLSTITLAIFLGGLPTPLLGQATGTVTGIVTGTTGVPIPAVQVFVTNSALGTLTNESGRFLLTNVPSGEVELRAEHLGHRTGVRTVGVRAGGSTVVDFTLTPAAIALDEIVVTGTGLAARKRQLGNTIATVDVERLGNAPIASFSELLQGREPSVVAFTSDGATGSGARLRIRGSNSLSMQNEPLVYVDGIRVDNAGDMQGGAGGGDRGSRLDDVNWEAVDRVEILKGAAAATLYGSEASSGVIQIFTKSGGSGPARFTARMEMGTSSVPDVIPAQAGFARNEGHAAHLSEMFGQTLAPFEVFERDFTRDMLERGTSQTFSADVAGGSDDIQYYLAGRYSFEDGPLGAQSLGGGATDELTRVQTNASMTFLPREGLTFRFTGAYTDTGLLTYGRNNNIGSPTSTAMASKPERANCFASALAPGRTFGESTPVCTGPGNPWGAWIFGTPREAMHAEWENDARHFSGSTSGSWEGGPGLSVEALFGLDQVDERSDELRPFGWNVDGSSVLAEGDGERRVETRTHREITFDAKVGWSTDIGDDYRSEFVAGGQRFFSDSRFASSFGEIFPAAGIEILQASEVTGATDFLISKVSLGGFVQEQFSYQDWLFATLGARFDRSSAFGRDAGSAFYPKAGLSALVSELPSWGLDWLPTLRVRAALGKSGLQPGAFDRATSYIPTRTPVGGGIAAGNLGNPNLKPERSTEIELGAEGELLGGRLGFNVTYWDRTTHDALISRQFPFAGGFASPQLDNIGQLDAHGWELQLNGLAVDRPDVSLGLFANAAYTSELITSMGGVIPIKVSGTYTRHRNFLAEGFAPGSFMGAKMIPVCGGPGSGPCYTPGATVPFDSNRDGAPDSLAEFHAFLTSMGSVFLNDPRLAPLMADEDGDGDILDHFLGKPTPDWQGSFGADLTLWNRLTVNGLFEYRAGNYSVSNLTRGFRNSHPGVGRNTRETAEVESTLMNPATQNDADARVAAAMKWATELLALAPYSGLNQIEPGDFLRWRELSATYRVPSDWSSRAGLNDVTVTVTGRNLAVWTKYGGVEPEGNEISRCGGGGEVQQPIRCNFLEATETYNLPLPRRLAMSVRVVF